MVSPLLDTVVPHGFGKSVAPVHVFLESSQARYSLQNAVPVTVSQQQWLPPLLHLMQLKVKSSVSSSQARVKGSEQDEVDATGSKQHGSPLLSHVVQVFVDWSQARAAEQNGSRLTEVSLQHSAPTSSAYRSATTQHHDTIMGRNEKISGGQGSVMHCCTSNGCAGYNYAC